MNESVECGADPEFGLRLVGYARREVDAFVAEVRRELRDLAPEDRSGDVRILAARPAGSADDPARPAAPDPDTAVSRLIGYAQQEADRRLAEATGEAERTLRGARELADTMLAEARQRAAELEARIADALEREFAARVSRLTRTHAQTVAGLAGMRRSLDELLTADAELGPLDPPAFVDLVPQQRDLVQLESAPVSPGQRR